MRVRTVLGNVHLWITVGAACAAAFAACDEAGSIVPTGGGMDASASDVSVSDAPGNPAADSGGRGDGHNDGSLDAGDCATGPSGEFLDLRCTGLYSDWATKTVSPNVQEFTPGLQLWSDGAVKTRYAYIPPGQKIDTSNMNEWTFPVGTKFWKEFKAPRGSSTTPVRIETRLLWKQSEGNWYKTTYAWSDDGDAVATELTAGELDANGNGLEIPSQIQCGQCHNGRLDEVLGFEAVGLSAPGTTGITLQDLIDGGMLTNPPTGPFVIPGNATEVAALGWIHVNCGTSCHNRGNGIAGATTDFFTRLDVETLGSVESTDTYTKGWNQPTQGFSVPGAAETLRFHACDPAGSAAYYRAARRTGVDGTPTKIQMPPIDTHVTQAEGLAIMAAWINEGCSVDAGDDGGPSVESGTGGGPNNDAGTGVDSSVLDSSTVDCGIGTPDGTVATDGSDTDAGTTDAGGP